MTPFRTRARRAGLPGLSLLVVMLAGCVERTMVITTEPFGAVVFDERGIPLSASPADRSFVYYGKYRFTIVKDGYETLVVEEDIKPPWYEWIGIDFISENLIPWTVRDVHRFHYRLKEMQIVSGEQVLEQGKLLRARGLTIGEPAPPDLPRGQPAAPAQPPGILSNPGPLLLPPGTGQPEPRPGS
jgi:hypothetical protein